MSERDERIYQMRESGMTFSAIGKEYGISGEFAHEIYKRVIKRHERDADPLYKWLRKAGSEWHASHGYALLRRNGIKTVEQAEKLEAVDVLEMHGGGMGFADLIERAKSL